jgi:hypothetical protein
MENKIPKIKDKIRVKTKLDGEKLCEIDWLNDKTIHFKNKNFGMAVNSDRVTYTSNSWKGANFIYTSFN